LLGGGFRLAHRSADGVGDEVLLHESTSFGLSSDWSRDGMFVLRALVDPQTRGDIWVVPLSNGAKAFPYLNNDYNEAQPRLSPNGRWLAYVTDRLGHFEVYVDAFSADASKTPAARGTWPISSGGGTRPVWSRDGKQLFFISADRKMMAVDVNPDAQGRFDFAAPKPLFDAPINGNPWDEFDVSNDGRFLLPVPGQQRSREPLTVIVNWPQLKR
jgi:serine/threonine-protein kinase